MILKIMMITNSTSKYFVLTRPDFLTTFQTKKIGHLSISLTLSVHTCYNANAKLQAKTEA